MQLAVTLSHVAHLAGERFEGVLDFAVTAEREGIDQIVVTDHVVLGTALDAHSALGGAFPYPPDESYPDPLVTLAAMGARTERIRLSTGLLIAPLRPAVLLAKMVATVDALSGGRLDLGVGTGWQVEEFDALGVPMEHKAQRMDDTVRACQALWRDRPASFESSTVRFSDIYCVPTPANGMSVPIWFGGTANAATARRVAELGAGWLPMGMPPLDVLEHGIKLLRDEYRERGRDPETVAVRVMLAPCSTVEETVACVPSLARLGATAVAIPIGNMVTRASELGPMLRRFRELVPRRMNP